MTPNPNMDDLLRIESAAPSDEAALLAFFRHVIADTFQKEGIGLLHETIAEEVADKMRLFQAYLDAADQDPPTHRFLVARRKGEIIATLTYGPSGAMIRRVTQGTLSGYGELGSAYVLPRSQGQGIASEMIGKMLKELQDTGIQTFIFDSGYVRAQKIWTRKFGDPYMVLPDFWGPGGHHMIWCSAVTEHLKKSRKG